MKTLKQRHEEWLDKWEQDGGIVHKFYCPHCEKLISCHAPSNNDVWDSICVCPECQNLYMRFTTKHKAWGVINPAYS